MQLKSAEQSEHDAIHDRVFAAMETGNTYQARVLYEEYNDVHPALADAIHTDVLREYGVSL